MPPQTEGSNLRGATLFVLGLLTALLCLGAFFWLRRSDSRPGTDSGSSAGLAESGVPEAPFRNVTAAAGLQFVHQTGAYGEKLLPETMGGGCAFLDFNNDLAQDLLFVNSGNWPWSTNYHSENVLALYQNDGHGQYKEVARDMGLTTSIYGMGVAAGDYDNDGFADLFVSGVGGNRLFHNDGGERFTDVTLRAGLGASTNWSTSCAWFDYDNDGDLDLFVCNYVQWSREIDLAVDYKLAGLGRAYGPPMNFAGSYPSLYRNEGNGTFKEVSAECGIQVRNKATGQPLGKSLGVAPVDMDGDGWIDLIVANDTVPNFVFHNERNGTFKEIGAVSGLALDSYGSARGAMGIDSGRFQDANTLGISIGNFANEMTALYVSQADPLLYSDQAISLGIGNASRVYLTFGVFFFDYDLDGWLDLLTANGHIEPEINRVMPSQQYAQPPQLYWNARSRQGPNGYILVPPAKCGPDLSQPLVGRGSACADMDDDGDLDVVITQCGAKAVLLRNDQQLKRYWVRLKLAGSKSNRDAIGAWVKVKIGSTVLSQQVMPVKGYLSQSELPLTFGLGASDHVDEVIVKWPGGREENIKNIRIDALNRITETR